MQQRLTIITLGVSDLEGAENFYINKLGWEKSPMSTESITFIKLNGILLSLYPRESLADDAGMDSSGTGFKGFTLAYNARSEEEVDKLFSRFKSLDIKIVKNPEKVFWGGYSGYISDPDGNLWEIAYNPYLELDSDGNV